jgi:hypothetical protein
VEYASNPAAVVGVVDAGEPFDVALRDRAAEIGGLSWIMSDSGTIWPD